MRNKELYINKLVSLGMSIDEAENLLNNIETDIMYNDGVEYYIHVDYITGDSFNTEEASENIELKWHNLNIVKENLNRIQEHLKLYNELEGWNHDRSEEEILADWAKRPWAVMESEIFKDRKITHDKPSEFTIYFIKDDNTPVMIHLPWIGYFEHNQRPSIRMKNLNNC